MTFFSSIDSIKDAWAERKSALSDTRRQTIERRERAVMQSIAHGIPTTRNEEWKYTSLRPLVAGQFDLIEAIRNPREMLDGAAVDAINEKLVPNAIPIVFVDGRLDLSWAGSEDLDPDFFRTLADVELEEDSDWWDVWQTTSGMDQIFSSLNAGLAHEGVVISVNPRQEMSRPIHILHLNTGKLSSAARMNRVIVHAAESSRLRVYEDFWTIDERALKQSPSWANALTQFKLDHGASVGYFRTVHAANQFHTGSVTAILEKNSRLETFSLTTAAKMARVNIDVTYTGTDAECVLNGLYLVQGSDHVDHHTSVDHKVGRCRTFQFYKGILADQSRAVFNGKIFIRPDAQQTEAYQTNKNLLLSSEAEVDTKPQLEIDADDVKASHGAAIGSVDPAELFYLQSRCIGRAEALSMLSRGFAEDVVGKITDLQAKLVFSRKVKQWFKQFAEHQDAQGNTETIL
jgi:Fe-S cluster assembly protein SufD